MDNQQPSRIEWRTAIKYDRYEANRFEDMRKVQRLSIHENPVNLCGALLLKKMKIQSQHLVKARAVLTARLGNE